MDKLLLLVAALLAALGGARGEHRWGVCYVTHATSEIIDRLCLQGEMGAPT